MGSLFKSKKVRDEHPEALSQVRKQEQSVDQFTTNPGYQYQRGQLEKISSGNYGALTDVMALRNEAARADKANKYRFTSGAGAFNANPLLQQAMRDKQAAGTQENFALQIPSLVSNAANNASGFVQNAVQNQASGYSNTAQGYQNAIKYSYKKPLLGSILGAAAPFLNFIPGVGSALSAGAGAISGAMGQGNADVFGNSGGAGYQAQPYSFSSGARGFKQAQEELNNQNAASKPNQTNLAATPEQLSGPKAGSVAAINAEPAFKKFRSPFLD